MCGTIKTMDSIKMRLRRCQKTKKTRRRETTDNDQGKEQGQTEKSGKNKGKKEE